MEILSSTKAFFVGTALSRVSGLFRDMAIAVSFGISPEIAGFMVAYRFANLFRRLLGEGNLQAGFVPHYTSLKENGPAFYRDTAYSFSLILISFIFLLEMLLWTAAQFLSADWVFIAHLAMWMAPGLFFISHFALNASLLQCQKKYFLPAVSPVAFNFIWIAFALLSPDVQTLSLGVTLAFMAQWLFTLPPSLPFLKGRPQLFSSDFKALLKPLLLGVAGIGAVQFNSALDTVFARFSDLRGPAYLWYAIRLEQLPMALFGIALSNALLPPLSREQNPERKKELLLSALKIGSLFMLICTFGIFCLGGVGINLLYGHGDFSPSDVQKTLGCLIAYSVGLIPSTFVLLLANYFYAKKDYKTPTQGSFYSVIINLLLNAFFVFVLHLGAISVALATAFSALFNAIWLSKGIFELNFWTDFLKLSFGCLLACCLTLFVQSLLFFDFPRELSEQIYQAAFSSVIYLSTVALFVWKFIPRGIQRKVSEN